MYRKYRPKTFGEVTNQNHIKITLQNEIESGRLGHAYLFCGPRGTGKTTLARLLAKAVNCENLQPKGEPCNACPSCEEIMAGRALDVIEIDAASHTGVDNVRENIINNARFTPTRNKYKVFIIDEVHMLSISAFNALLKILEEPPQYVIFVLATTEAHKVPSTIVSRCQRFDYKKIIVEELVARLRWIIAQENVRLDETVLRTIAKHAQGCVRDAESLLEQVLSLGEGEIKKEQAELILPRDNFDLLYRLFELIIKGQKSEAILFINQLVADGVDAGQFLDSFVEFVRKILIFKVTADLADLAREVDDVMVKKIMAVVYNVTDMELVRIIEKCLTSKETFKQNYLTQLPLEMAVLELTQGKAQVEIKRPLVETKEPPVENVKREEVALPKVEKIEPVPVVEIKEEPKLAQATPNSAEFSDILVLWPQVLQKVKIINYSLYMSLRMGKPVNFAADKIMIGFLFELQRQRVANLINLNVIKDAILAIFGRKLELETVVDSSLKLTDLASNNISNGDISATDSVTDIANDFGGTVVDKI